MAPKLSQQEYDKRKKMLEEGFGWCSKCEQFKLIECFSKNKTDQFGLHRWCKECHSASRKGNKKVQKKARDRARYFISYYTKLAGGQCHLCGYNKSQSALDFHHINRETKEYAPSQLINRGGPHEEIIAEIDKCILICSNCHREFTAGEWTAEFIKKNDIGWDIKPGTIIGTNTDEFGDLPDKYKYVQPSLIK